MKASTKRTERKKLKDKYARMVATQLANDPDHYRKLGRLPKNRSFSEPGKAREAALKRHHPDWFDENGNLIREEN